MSDSSEQVKSILNKMKEMARPALRLTTADKPGFSKVGGRPNLPDGIPWPFWMERPLCFVAQLDLAELKVIDTLPEFPAEGRLYFFYPDWWQDERREPWQPWGIEPEDAHSAVVIYSLSPPGPAIEPPEEMKRPGLFAFEDTNGVYVERFISARPIISWPDPDLLLKFYDDFTEEERDEVREAHFELEKSQAEIPQRGPGLHQLGGYNYNIQNNNLGFVCNLATNGISAAFASLIDLDDPAVAALVPGAEDWQLMLQLDSDEGEDLPDDGGNIMVWGGYGCIYFWIRKQDLAARDFSKVWAIIEST